MIRATIAAMNRRAPIATCVLLSVHALVGCATSAQALRPSAGRTYRVRVRRPVAVGFRYRVEGRGEVRHQSETIDSFGRRSQGEEELSSAEFAGDVTVRALDAEGYVSSVAIEVRRAVADDSERSWSFLAPGTTITIRPGAGDDAPRVEQEGSALDPSAMRYLTLAYDLRNLYGFREEFFGAAGRRAVGDRWPVPALSMVTVATTEATVTREDGTRETIRLPPTASRNASSAEATLERVTRVDGVTCIEVRTALRVDARGPEGVTAQQTHEWSMLLPRSRRRPPLGMTSRDMIDSWSTVTIDGRPVRNHLTGGRTTIVRFAEIP
jgi:hypothetical protein